MEKLAHSGSDKYTRVFGSLEKAALDPSFWADVCDALSDLVGGSGTLLIPYDIDGRNTAMPHSPRLDEMIQSFVETGWARRDFRAKGFPKAISTGFVTDQELITPEEMRSHPFYAEWLASVGLRWFAGIAFEVEGKVWGAGIQGTPQRGPFLKEDIEILLGVREHLSRAARQASALGHQRLGSFTDAFASSGRGVAALDWLGNLSWMNATTEGLLRDAALLRNRQLHSEDAYLDGKLAHLVAGAVTTARAAPSAAAGPILVPFPGERLISIDAIPMPRDFQALLSGAAAILTVHEVAAGTAGRLDLRSRFRLTAREAELALHLTAGRSVAEAATIMGLSVATARQHLKSVLAKTGARRQAELVLLLGRLPS